MTATPLTNAPRLTMATAPAPRENAVPGGPCRRVRRRLMAGLGILNVALGTIGIFVPGLPTTVFLLVASYLFARSSPSLERRLLSDPRLGAYLRAARGRSMPLRAKIASMIGMWGGIATSVVLMGGPERALSLVVMGLGVIGTCAILYFTRTVPAGVGGSARA